MTKMEKELNKNDKMNNFDEYIIQGEPSQKEKAQIWQTASRKFQRAIFAL